MGQVPAYNRLKTIENYKTVRLISGHGHLLEVFVYKRFWSRDLTGKILVFWIDGCFMGGGRLRDERWWHMEVQLYWEFAEISRHFFFLVAMFSWCLCLTACEQWYYSQTSITWLPSAKGKVVTWWIVGSVLSHLLTILSDRTLVTGSLIDVHCLTLQ